MNVKNYWVMVYIIGISVLCFLLFVNVDNVEDNSTEHCEEKTMFRMTSCDFGEDFNAEYCRLDRWSCNEWGGYEVFINDSLFCVEEICTASTTTSTTLQPTTTVGATTTTLEIQMLVCLKTKIKIKDLFWDTYTNLKCENTSWGFELCFFPTFEEEYNLSLSEYKKFFGADSVKRKVEENCMRHEFVERQMTDLCGNPVVRNVSICRIQRRIIKSYYNRGCS